METTNRKSRRRPNPDQHRQPATSLTGRRAIIAGLVSAKASDTDAWVRTLTAILAEQGIEVIGSLIQRRGVSRSSSPGGSKRLDQPMSAATFIGPGKTGELAALARERSASLIVFLNDLSTTQIARLSEITGCVVIPASSLNQH